MYLVVECTTTSAPRASGCCRYGEAKVLSTTRVAPASCAACAIAPMSATASRGLVGVSSQTTLAVRSARARRTAAGSDTGTG